MSGTVDVCVTNITKSFGAQQVLRGVEFEAEPGSMTAVLGPSGCGKTTLLRILAGFENPHTGTVRVGGELLVGPGIVVPAHRRRIGLMPQEGALFAHLSVAGNIAFGLNGADRRNAPSVVEHWLEVVGLVGLGRARPAELSGGQQQRVALARALAARPRVLLLDEPFAALDAGLRLRVREDITAILRESGTTAVLVTHDQAEALSLSDSVVLLMDGVAAQHDPPQRLYQNPATLQVARFVGATVELAGTCHAGVANTILGSHPVRNAAPDGPAVLVARPEQLQLGGPADPTGTVLDRRFYGAYAALRVRLADGSDVLVQGPADLISTAGRHPGVRLTGSLLAYPSPSGG